jgi:hypothetical protein
VAGSACFTIANVGYGTVPLHLQPTLSTYNAPISRYIIYPPASIIDRRAP